MPTPIEQTFPRIAASVRAARGFVVDRLDSAGADPAAISTIELAVSELASNSIEHGHGDSFCVAIVIDDLTMWELTVTGSGKLQPRFLDPSTWRVAEHGEESGRGLGIVQSLMDSVEVAAHDDEVAVRCRLVRQGSISS